MPASLEFVVLRQTLDFASHASDGLARVVELNVPHDSDCGNTIRQNFRLPSCISLPSNKHPPIIMPIEFIALIGNNQCAIV